MEDAGNAEANPTGLRSDSSSACRGSNGALAAAHNRPSVGRQRGKYLNSFCPHWAYFPHDCHHGWMVDGLLLLDQRMECHW